MTSPNDVTEVSSTAQLEPATGLMAYAKAIVSAVIAALGAASTAYTGDQYIDKGEWIVVTSAFLVGLAGVWAVPNAIKAIKVLKQPV